MLFVNGKFYTGKGFSEAVFVKDGIIEEVGGTEALIKAHPNEEIVDLEKRLVIPGFNDSHIHVLSYSRFLESVNLRGAESKEEIIALGKKALENNNILVMYGCDDSFFPAPLTRSDLDLISSEKPVIVHRSCGHIAFVNSSALRLLPEGEAAGYIDPENGILKEDAVSLLEKVFPKESPSRLKERIRRTMRNLNSLGITSLATGDVAGDLEEGLRIVEAYRELEEEGELSARVSLKFAFIDEEKIKAFWNRRSSSPYFRFGPLKLYLDGSLGGSTALLSEPYRPGYYGIQTLTCGKLQDLLEFSEANGIQVAAHAIGDEACALFLDAFKKTCKRNSRRHFLIHLQVLRKDLLAEMQALGIPASLQPIFLEEDLKMAKRKLSQNLLKTSYAFRSIAALTVAAFSSDAPYGGVNPFRGLRAALTQEDGDGEILNPEERMGREEALKAYTANSAYLTFEEKVKGRIAPGFFADFAALSDDYFSVPEREIAGLRADVTVVGGKIVYRR